MSITPENKATAVQVVGIYEALFNKVPPTEGALHFQTSIFKNVDQYAARIMKKGAFKSEYIAPNGNLKEFKLIAKVFKNLDLKPPKASGIKTIAKKFDGPELLAWLLTRPAIKAAIEKQAEPFVQKVIDGHPVSYDTSLADQPVNEAPTGINMSALPDIDETTPAGTAVGTLQAIDPDAGDTHTFELVNEPGTVPFSIEGDKIIYNGTDVDGDTEYVLNIKVTDSAWNESEIAFPVSVKVIDEDELPPIPVEPGALVMGDDDDNLFTGVAAYPNNTLQGAFIDGKGGTDTLKVIADTSSGLHSAAVINVPESKIGGFEGDYVGGFHTENVERFELKQFGQGDQLIVDLGGMGEDLEEIVSDSAQAEDIAFANIAKADGLRVAINHTQAWHIIDFKKGATTGEETVTVAVDHVGATVDTSEGKHGEPFKGDPGYKGIKIALTEAGLTEEHGKLAEIKELALEFNGEQPSVIKAIEAGDTLETISGSGDADAVVGSFEHTLFYTNNYITNVDMSATNGDNAYVVAWDDHSTRAPAEDEGSHIGRHSIWKVPTYDEHGHVTGHEALTFNGGSGDETLYLGRGAVGLTADGGAGEDTVIFSDLPIGKDNSFSNFDVAKIFAEVGSKKMYSGDPTDHRVDILDASAIAGIYDVEFSCGLQCYEYDGPIKPALTDFARQEYTNLALINLEADQEYTFTFKAGDHLAPEVIVDDGKDKEHKPADMGELEYRHEPWREGKVLTLAVDVGEVDTEGNSGAGNGTNDVLNLVLEDDLDVNFVGGETEVLNIDGATYDGWGRHHITFIKKDIEKTAVPQTEKDGSPWVDEHGDQVIKYYNKEDGLEHAEDLHTINLTGEADYFAITSEKNELTPNLTLIDARGTEGGTRLFVEGVGSNEQGMTVHGTKNDDTIRGTHGDDELYGYEGSDELSGNGGDDMLFGGEDVDSLSGGGGSDLIDGGAGADWMEGGGNAATIKEIIIEGLIGDGDFYTVQINAHGHEATVNVQFSLHEFYRWLKDKWENDDGQSMTEAQFDERVGMMGRPDFDALKLYHLQHEIAYELNKKLYEKGLGDDIDVSIDHHGRLIVTKESGLDFELDGFAQDGHGREDDPEMATVTIEKDHYDYGDIVKITVREGGMPPPPPPRIDDESIEAAPPPPPPPGKMFFLKITEDLDTNGDHYVDEKEVAAALAHELDYEGGGVIKKAELLDDGKTVKLTSNKKGFHVDAELIDARAHISFHLPNIFDDRSPNHHAAALKIVLGEDGAETEIAFDNAEAGLLALFHELGYPTAEIYHDPYSSFDQPEGSMYIVKNGEHEVGKITMKSAYDKIWVTIEGPAEGSPFANTAAAESLAVHVVYYDDQKDQKVFYDLPVDKWLDVSDNGNPWVENTVEDTTEDIDFGVIQPGDPDGSDTFVVSEENPVPVDTHADPFKPGDEMGLVDMVKDFVTHYEEMHNDHAKEPAYGDVIDFEGFDDQAIDGETFESIDEPTAANYLEALEAAEALHDIFEELVYIASSYEDGDGVSTAVFAFDNTDTGNDLNTPDSAVILVGVGPGEVTADDIIADHNAIV